MRGVLLGMAVSLAAMSLPAAPASAQGGSCYAGSSYAGRHSVHVHRSSDFRTNFRSPARQDRNVAEAAWFGDREYQGDTTWRADSFNDWWHDRPDRSFPRWVGATNGSCERQWWSDAGWHC